MVTGVEVFRDEGWIGMVRVVSSRITYGQRSCRYRYPNTHPTASGVSAAPEQRLRGGAGAHGAEC